MSTFDRNLKAMLDDMEHAPEAYKPTNFWSSGLPGIIKDIENLGVETFRTHPSAAFFYVPLYASGTYQKWKHIFDPIAQKLPPRKRARLMQRLTHSDRARADYRIYRATSTDPGLPLDHVTESDVGGGERFTFDGRSYSRSMLNYLRALNFYKRLCPDTQLGSCLEIGGGYGSLGEILLQANPDSFYMNIDIPPVASVSTYYLQEIFGKDAVLTYAESREMEEIDIAVIRKRYRAAVICPWQIPKLKGSVDLFANFMSFQEMEPAIVQNYAQVIQPLIARHILMRNTAVGKKIAQKRGDVGVNEQVRSDFVQKAFDQFQTLGRDAFVYGDENETGSYRSEVVMMARRES